VLGGVEFKGSSKRDDDVWGGKLIVFKESGRKGKKAARRTSRIKVIGGHFAFVLSE